MITKYTNWNKQNRFVYFPHKVSVCNIDCEENVLVISFSAFLTGSSWRCTVSISSFQLFTALSTHWSLYYNLTLPSITHFQSTVSHAISVFYSCLLSFLHYHSVFLILAFVETPVARSSTPHSLRAGTLFLLFLWVPLPTNKPMAVISLQ